MIKSYGFRWKMALYKTCPDFATGKTIKEYAIQVLSHEKVKKVLDQFHAYRRMADLVMDSIHHLRDSDQLTISNEDSGVFTKVLEDIEMIKKPALLKYAEELLKHSNEENRSFANFIQWSTDYLIDETLPYFPKGTIGFNKKNDELIHVFCLYLWLTPRSDQMSDFGTSKLAVHRQTLLSNFSKHLRHDGSGDISLVYDDPESWCSIKIQNTNIVVDESAIQLLTSLFLK